MKATLELARFHLLSVWNWRTTHLSRVIEAPAYFLFMVAGLATLSPDRRAGGMPYEDFAFAGVLVVIAIRTLFWTMGDVANDRKWGVYAISRTLRVSFARYIVSIMVANGLVALVQILAIALLKQLTGRGHPGQDLAMCLLALLITMLSIMTGCALGFAVNSYSKRDLLTSLFSLPLVLTAPLFYSLEAVPVYVKALAVLNPFTYGVMLVRSPATGTFPLAAAAGCAVTAAVVTGALAVAARGHELISAEQG